MIIPLTAGIQLHSGAFMNYADPGACEVTIDDVALALGNICRFSGHVSQFYSVAQHAVNTSMIVAPEFAFDALLHDLAEAFTNDIPTPLKTAIPAFKGLEILIESAMAVRFGFEFPLSPAIKHADLQMLKLEKEAFKPNASGNWEVLEGVEIDSVRHLVDLDEWGPQVARAIFLDRYEELTA
jgi:hypothetical protein